MHYVAVLFVAAAATLVAADDSSTTTTTDGHIFNYVWPQLPGAGWNCEDTIPLSTVTAETLPAIQLIIPASYTNTTPIGTTDPTAYNAAAVADVNAAFATYVNECNATLAEIDVLSSECPGYTTVTDRILQVHMLCFYAFQVLNDAWVYAQSDPATHLADVQQAADYVQQGNALLVDLGQYVQPISGEWGDECTLYLWKICHMTDYMAYAVFEYYNQALLDMVSSTARPGDVMKTCMTDVATMLRQVLDDFEANVEHYECSAPATGN